MNIAFFFLLSAITVGVLAFIGWRYNQYKKATKLKQVSQEPKFHPAFSNPQRTRTGATLNTV